jgi:hypothetical protein
MTDVRAVLILLERASSLNWAESLRILAGFALRGNENGSRRSVGGKRRNACGTVGRTNILTSLRPLRTAIKELQKTNTLSVPGFRSSEVPGFSRAGFRGSQEPGSAVLKSRGSGVTRFSTSGFRSSVWAEENL